MTEFLIKPSINNKSLFKYKNTINGKGEKIDIPIIEEKPLTQGTVFGDLFEEIESVKLNKKNKITNNQLLNLSKKINLEPSLYLKVGAIHGCVLCQEDRPLYYFEDVGRHNAVDKIAGLILEKKLKTENMSFYTSGRLTSEMVIKCIKMRIPILLSRSGFTSWAVEIARKKDLTMIGRLRGKRFSILSGSHRIVSE